jgi:Lar family restriction alleviation protein
VSGVELAACPFCGGNARTTQRNPVKALWYVQCDNCDASQHGQLGIENAIAAWNRRAVPMEAVAWREKVARAICTVDEQNGGGPWEWHAAQRRGCEMYYEYADAILQALALIPQAEETVK